MRIIITEEQKKKLFIPRKLSDDDSIYSEWNNKQPMVDGDIINIINKINNKGYSSLNEKERTFYSEEIFPFIMVQPQQHYQKKIKLNQKYLYHYAPIELRNTILKNGLIPKLGEMTLKGFGIDVNRYQNTTLKGKSTDDFWHRIKIVNLAKHGVDVTPKPKIFLFLTIQRYFDDERDLWRIDLTDLNVDFYDDDNLGNAVCTNNQIPPNNLELMMN